MGFGSDVKIEYVSSAYSGGNAAYVNSATHAMRATPPPPPPPIITSTPQRVYYAPANNVAKPITSMTVPCQYTTTAPQAMIGNPTLHYIELYGGTRVIGKGFCFGLDQLSQVVFDDNILHIGDSAF